MIPALSKLIFNFTYLKNHSHIGESWILAVCSGHKSIFANQGQDRVHTQASIAHFPQVEYWKTGHSFIIPAEYPEADFPRVCIQMEGAWDPV